MSSPCWCWALWSLPAAARSSRWRPRLRCRQPPAPRPRSTPARPRLVGTVAQIPNTTQEDVKVRHISTAAFTGELLAAGIQRCDRAGTGGLALYDVTNPLQPKQLGFFATGVARGVHELDLIQ